MEQLERITKMEKYLDEAREILRTYSESLSCENWRNIITVRTGERILRTIQREGCRMT